jgi:hypothetical protein
MSANKTAAVSSTVAPIPKLIVDLLNALDIVVLRFSVIARPRLVGRAVAGDHPFFSQTR